MTSLSAFPGAPPGDTLAWLVRVHGRVQGVGYRDACVRRARMLGLAGWVRNRADGTVEALLQGPAAAVTAMRDWLQDGVPAATVHAVAVTKVAPAAAGLRPFERRPTA